MTKNTLEQRNHPRKSVSCVTEFRIKGDSEVHEGHVINLSKGGVFFVTHKEVLPGHELLIKVFAGECNEQDIYANVEVIRCITAEKDELYGVACAIWKKYEKTEIGTIFP